MRYIHVGSVAQFSQLHGGVKGKKAMHLPWVFASEFEGDTQVLLTRLDFALGLRLYRPDFALGVTAPSTTLV